MDSLRCVLDELASGDRRVTDAEIVIESLVTERIETFLEELTILANDIDAGRVSADFDPNQETLYVCAEAIRQYIRLHRESTGG